MEGVDAVKKLDWIKEKAQRRMGERIFYKRDELKQRRDVRKIKKLQNNNKYKAMKSKSKGGKDGLNSNKGLRRG